MNKFLAFLTILLLSLQISAQSFKEKFYDAYDDMRKSYLVSALPKLQTLGSENSSNMNIKAMIGYCYLHSAYEKEKAIPYYEEILKDYKNLDPNYSNGNHRIKKAPYEVIRFLGQAYHFNYQFDKAMERYEEYQELVEGNEELTKEIVRDIQITRNATELQKFESEVEFVALGSVVNTRYAEYRPIVNADESMMIFTSRRDEGVNEGLGVDGLYPEDLYVSHKNAAGQWEEAKLMSTDINTKDHEACLYLSAAGDHMYLYKSDTTEGGIYESFLEGETWSEPELMMAKINSEHWETHANLSADGKTIAFVSERPDGTGKRDIYIMKRLPTGEWSDVQEISPLINTELDEESPFLHPDGRTLYFSSKGHNTMGGFDVFVSELDEDGQWTEPRNIGYPINTTGDDLFFVPSADGTRAYFSSYRSGGIGAQDIYVIELIDEAQKKLTIYKGFAKDTLRNVIKDLVITVFDEETSDIFGEYRPNSKTGKFLFILKPGFTYEVEYEVDGVIATETIKIDETTPFNELGRLIVKEKDKITVLKDEVLDPDIFSLADKEKATSIDIVEIAITIPDNITDKIKEEKEEALQGKIDAVLSSGKALVLKNLQFYFDKTKILPKSEPELDFVYKYLVKNPDARITIEGHTDSKGDAKYNQYLSRARAKKIKETLYKKGIKYDRMESAGFGEAKPLVPNKNPDGSDSIENRQKNRRVEFRIIK